LPRYAAEQAAVGLAATGLVANLSVVVHLGLPKRTEPQDTYHYDRPRWTTDWPKTAIPRHPRTGRIVGGWQAIVVFRENAGVLGKGGLDWSFVTDKRSRRAAGIAISASTPDHVDTASSVTPEDSTPIALNTMDSPARTGKPKAPRRRGNTGSTTRPAINAGKKSVLGKGAKQRDDADQRVPALRAQITSAAPARRGRRRGAP